MKEEIKKPEEKKTKALTSQRFRVVTDTREYDSVPERSRAISLVSDLQTQNVSPIYLFDDHEKTAFIYKKERHEQNYRVKSHSYTEPQTLQIPEEKPQAIAEK